MKITTCITLSSLAISAAVFACAISWYMGNMAQKETAMVEQQTFKLIGQQTAHMAKPAPKVERIVLKHWSQYVEAGR